MHQSLTPPSSKNKREKKFIVYSRSWQSLFINFWHCLQKKYLQFLQVWSNKYSTFINHLSNLKHTAKDRKVSEIKHKTHPFSWAKGAIVLGKPLTFSRFFTLRSQTPEVFKICNLMFQVLNMPQKNNMSSTETSN